MFIHVRIFFCSELTSFVLTEETTFYRAVDPCVVVKSRCLGPIRDRSDSIFNTHPFSVGGTEIHVPGYDVKIGQGWTRTTIYIIAQVCYTTVETYPRHWTISERFTVISCLGGIEDTCTFLILQGKYVQWNLHLRTTLKLRSPVINVTIF